MSESYVEENLIIPGTISITSTGSPFSVGRTNSTIIDTITRNIQSTYSLSNPKFGIQKICYRISTSSLQYIGLMIIAPLCERIKEEPRKDFLYHFNAKLIFDWSIFNVQ
jgi:hypothetical protein